MASQKKALVGVPALRLVLGGAPATWHFLGDKPGMYHPTIPVPLDAVGVTAETAQAWHDHEGVPVELVQITETEAAAARALFPQAVEEAALAAAHARLVTGAETLTEEQRIAQQLDAIRDLDNPTTPTDPS